MSTLPEKGDNTNVFSIRTISLDAYQFVLLKKNLLCLARFHFQCSIVFSPIAEKKRKKKYIAEGNKKPKPKTQSNKKPHVNLHYIAYIFVCVYIYICIHISIFICSLSLRICHDCPFYCYFPVAKANFIIRRNVASRSSGVMLPLYSALVKPRVLCPIQGSPNKRAILEIAHTGVSSIQSH